MPAIHVVCLLYMLYVCYTCCMSAMYVYVLNLGNGFVRFSYLQMQKKNCLMVLVFLYLNTGRHGSGRI